MASNYTVQQGDSLTSIGFDFRLNWETIWNHPNNAALKNLRKDPHVLYPGDVVYIPDMDPRLEDKSADAHHKFARKSALDRFRVRLTKDFQPRANIPYTLVVDGQSIDGTTDGDGLVDQPISPGAREGKLVLDGGKEEYEFALGNIDPIDTVSGLQGRLQNLGYFAGEVTGEMDDDTTDAVRAFQAACGLSETGEPDDSTLAKLKSEYGC
ncbi:MAG TPA: peptidoglycan-binding protein [Bryobacteraceae bacterium]|nr:peptidoglycan-binding protein [Bryobacteraceae bacterium]